jgi:hypothetical protein
MQIKVGRMKGIMRAMLISVALICCLGVFGPRLGLDRMAPIGAGGRLCLAYVITMLSFAAYPHKRRADLLKIIILAALFAEMMNALAGCPIDPAHVVADLTGALAVFVPSYLERFRAIARGGDHRVFSMAYPHDRRRRSPAHGRSDALQSASSYAAKISG